MAKSIQMDLGGVVMWGFKYLGMNMWDVEFVDAEGETVYETTHINAHHLTKEEALAMYHAFLGCDK